MTVEEINLALDMNEQEHIYGLAAENMLKTSQDKALQEASSEMIALGMHIV